MVLGLLFSAGGKVMNYVVFAYSVILVVSIYFGYKNKFEVSVTSWFISLLLCLSSVVNLFYFNNFLKLLISILLLLISVSFFYDRQKSGNQINYSHHCIRLILHVLIIYYLFV